MAEEIKSIKKNSTTNWRYETRITDEAEPQNKRQDDVALLAGELHSKQEKQNRVR